MVKSKSVEILAGHNAGAYPGYRSSEQLKLFHITPNTPPPRLVLFLLLGGKGTLRVKCCGQNELCSCPDSSTPSTAR